MAARIRELTEGTGVLDLGDAPDDPRGHESLRPQRFEYLRDLLFFAAAERIDGRMAERAAAGWRLHTYSRVPCVLLVWERPLARQTDLPGAG